MYSQLNWGMTDKKNYWRIYRALSSKSCTVTCLKKYIFQCFSDFRDVIVEFELWVLTRELFLAWHTLNMFPTLCCELARAQGCTLLCAICV